MTQTGLALAKRIYQLGERMITALNDGHLKTFAALVDERDLLVDRLDNRSTPDDENPEWNRWRSKLADQHEELTDALDAYRQDLETTMHQLERLDTAHREYQRSEPQSGVLNDRFSV